MLISILIQTAALGFACYCLWRMCKSTIEFTSATSKNMVDFSISLSQMVSEHLEIIYQMTYDHKFKDQEKKNSKRSEAMKEAWAKRKAKNTE